MVSLHEKEGIKEWQSVKSSYLLESLIAYPTSEVIKLQPCTALLGLWPCNYGQADQFWQLMCDCLQVLLNFHEGDLVTLDIFGDTAL